MSETTKTEEYNGELPTTIRLKHPVRVGKDTKLEELTFSEIPDGMAMAKMPIGDAATTMEDLYPIMASMAKRPEQHIRKIKWPDLKLCLPIVTYFLAE